MKESPIFVKTFDLAVWTLERTRKFPKDQRFVMARRIEEATLDLYDRLIEAGRSPGPRSRGSVGRVPVVSPVPCSRCARADSIAARAARRIGS